MFGWCCCMSFSVDMVLMVLVNGLLGLVMFMMVRLGIFLSVVLR